jgi:hypothetical protein
MVSNTANTKTDTPITIPEIAPMLLFFSSTPFLTVGVKSGNAKVSGLLIWEKPMRCNSSSSFERKM